MSNKKPAGYWTLERLKEEALKYETRTELSVKCKSAYNKIIKLGLLEELCQHMNGIKTGTTAWTLEEIEQEALKYKSRECFKKGSSRAYYAARARNKLNEVCSHMKKPISKRTPEQIKEIASKYKTRGLFQKHAKGAYSAALRLGIMDEISEHMIPHYKWTKEKIVKEARKYNYRIQFSKGSPGAYDRAYSLNILDEVCSHMLPLGHKHARCVYELRAGSKVYVGITCNFDRRIKAHRKANKLDCSDFTAVQLTDYIDAIKALQIERQLILLNNKSDSHESYNIYSGGSLGGTVVE